AWAVLLALREHDAFSAAGAMAFQFFLSLIPLLVLVGFVVGRLVRIRGVDPVMAPMLDLLPEAASDLVKRELEGMAGAGSAPVAPLSVLGFLLVASNGTHAMMNVFERAFGAHRRPWWKKRLIASAWLLSVVGTLSFATWGLSKLDRTLHAREVASSPAAPSQAQRASAEHAAASDHAPGHAAPSPHPSTHHATSATPAPTTTSLPISDHESVKPRRHSVHHTEGEKLFAFAVIFLITFIALGALYRFAIEHPKGIERRVWPGAAVAIAFWFPVSYAFGAYVGSLGDYVAYYGSLAAVAVVLIWLYLTSLVLVAGGELNALLEGVREAPPSLAPRSLTP
ncbi:MAG: YihY/virulence factor BrkB family protein, partial [Polyangiaceae bacterium]